MAAERHGEENKNKSKEQKGEEKKERRSETGGERARGEKEKKGRRMGTWAHGYMEPGPEGPQQRGHDSGKGGRSKKRWEGGQGGHEPGERGKGEAERAD